MCNELSYSTSHWQGAIIIMTLTEYPARLSELKERYRIPDAWKDLGYEGQPSRSCHVPWREDRHPSFSVYDDGKAWKDFSTDEAGDVVAFVMTATGMPFKEALQWCLERAGMAEHSYSYHVATRPRERPSRAPEPPKELKLPDLHKGDWSNIREVARTRGIWSYAVKVAVEIGTLRFGHVCGERCWILIDDSRKIAEARRLDGRPFDAVGTLPARKAHTIAGSSKSWPFGLTLADGMAAPDATILLVEGGPDYLAAFDFMAQNKAQKFHPVAMLGKSNRISSKALEVMIGRKVRIYPHTDGLEAAQGWFEQLKSVGCKVNGFGFEGFKRKDGKPVSDLNDFLLTPKSEQAEAWKGVLPA